MSTKKLYRGFSTSNYINTRSLAIYDIDLIKQDIINHIYTRVGERLMMPQFGTSIPDMPFEQMDATSVGLIREDIKRVLNYDPRIRVQQLIVDPAYDENTVRVSALVNYIELNMTGSIDLNIEFDDF